MCPNCGNTDAFLFRIYAFPLAIVGEKDGEEYEIKDVLCKQDGTVGEEVLCCMVCGCAEVEIVDKKDMPAVYAALEEGKRKLEEE